MKNEYLNNNIFESLISQFQLSQKEKEKCELHVAKYVDKKGRKSSTHKEKHLLAIKQLELAEQVYVAAKTELAYAFLTLSKNIVGYAKFSLIEEDDAIQEGAMICFDKIGRFDPNYRGKYGKKTKAFNYMTTCILNHFRQLYRTARNYNELKKKYLDMISSKFEESGIRIIRDHPQSSRDLS